MLLCTAGIYSMFTVGTLMLRAPSSPIAHIHDSAGGSQALLSYSVSTACPNIVMKVEWSNLQQGTGVTGKITCSLWLDYDVSIALTVNSCLLSYRAVLNG